MTVAELITELGGLPPDWLVYVEGYEDGYRDLTQVAPERFRRDVMNSPWDGEHVAEPTGDHNGVALLAADRGGRL